MRRSGFVAALAACGIGAVWSGAARTTSLEARDLVALPVLVCRLIPMPAGLTWLVVLGSGLILLACLVALRLVYQTRRTVRAFAVGAEPAPDRLLSIMRRAGLRQDVVVADCSGPIAFTHGLLRPGVVLSRDLYEGLDDAELEAVLRHECAHARRRDPLRVLIARTLGTVCAFIPHARARVATYVCGIELSADRTTVKDMGDVIPLASALQRVMILPPRRDLATAAVSGLSATDIRIDHLLGLDTSPALIAEPANRIHLALFWVAVLALSCVLLASASAAARVVLCLGC